MDINQINNWISLTAIAVNVQEEIAAFRQGELLKGMQLACLNRLKVIASIVAHVIAELVMIFNTCSLLIDGEISLIDAGKILGIASLANLAYLTLGICALPFPELVLQGWILQPFCQLNDYAAPYNLAGMKPLAIRQFENIIWELAEETRDQLLAQGQLSAEELEMGNFEQLRLLMRATVLQLIQQWQVKDQQENVFEKKEDVTKQFTLARPYESEAPKRIHDIGPILAKAMQHFQKLNDQQKQVLEQLALEDKNLKDIPHSLSEEEKTFVVSLFHIIGRLENVLTKNLFNTQKDFELAAKAQHLVMCTEE